MASLVILTLGYPHRSQVDVLELLRQQDVRTLFDVRLNPFSHKPDFSTRYLAAVLNAAGITYAHLPALRNPTDNRRAYGAGDPAAFEHLRERYARPDACYKLGRILRVASEGRVALMCYERETRNCHRTLIVEELRRREPRLAVINL